MKALILIDLQNDFCPGGALPVQEGDQVVPVVNRLQERFSLIVATRDWHPANHGSFVTSHPGRAVGDTVLLNGIPQILWPPHCVQETPGAAFRDTLATSGIRKVFLKGTDPQIDSYSAFYDNAHQRSTGLGDYLRSMDAGEVYIAGLATEYSVKFSALDAMDLGFKTTVVEDACRGVNIAPGDHLDALERMRSRGVEIIRSSQILQDVQGP